ncbi:hypothetical protein HAX54_014851 [Datura stramonium]|uniref:Uncharacterized protein n=1 Tax=Datura stramonium TaxID=4076 RepID=A0ABS8TQR7_DATST|nr:hypothetical protein [Datura stramonium]
MAEKRTDGEGYISNAFQSIIGPMVHGGTNLEGPTEGGPISMVSLMTPSMIPRGTNFERPRSTLFVPDVKPKWLLPMVALSTILLPTLANVPKQFFHLEAPSRTSTQMVPLVDFSFFIIFFTNVSSNDSTSAFFITSTNRS